MVYTVTFNPAIDYVVHMDNDIEIGMTNRSSKEEYYCGGKGINVSKVLSELNIENTALGFIAGFTGDVIEEDVRKSNIKTDFIKLKKGISRINLKIKGNKETEINSQGPEIDKASNDELFDKLSLLKEGDILVLAGSIPNSLSKDIYEKILLMLKDKNVLSVVDATKELLTNVLKYKPFLIKPNNFELSEIVEKKLNTDEEIYEAALTLQKKGARNVLVSMAGDGAMLIDENQKKYRMGVPKGIVKNSVGAGDSMVAGFIAGYIESKNYEVALKMGTAAGSATAFSDGLAKREYIYEIYNKL